MREWKPDDVVLKTPMTCWGEETPAPHSHEYRFEQLLPEVQTILREAEGYKEMTAVVVAAFARFDAGLLSSSLAFAQIRDEHERIFGKEIP